MTNHLPADDLNSDVAGQWSDIELAGHTCEVYEPDQPSEHGYVVLYLHGIGVGRLSERSPFGLEFERHGLRVIAPLTGQSWWADRVSQTFDPQMSAQQYLLDHVLPYIAQRWNSRPTQIALLGISMGGQGGLRLSYQRPDTFPVVAAIASAVDFQLKIEEGDANLTAMYGDAESARQDTATLHIHPLNWPRHQWFACDPADTRWHESNDRLRMKLFSLGVLHECDLETTAGGHTWEYFNHMAPTAIGFLANALEHERLRVV